MELFGFSAAKIITILVIAIVIFGPDTVAEMARTAGRTIRDVRRYLNDMTKEFDAATNGLREEFTTVTRDLREELRSVQADLRSQLDLTDGSAETLSTPVASSVDAPIPGTNRNDVPQPSFFDDATIPHPTATASPTCRRSVGRSVAGSAYLREGRTRQERRGTGRHNAHRS